MGVMPKRARPPAAAAGQLDIASDTARARVPAGADGTGCFQRHHLGIASPSPTILNPPAAFGRLDQAASISIILLSRLTGGNSRLAKSRVRGGTLWGGDVGAHLFVGGEIRGHGQLAPHKAGDRLHPAATRLQLGGGRAGKGWNGVIRILIIDLFASGII